MTFSHWILILAALAAGMLSPARAAEEPRVYSGSVGRQRAEFTLRWNADGTVEGSYFCPGGKKEIYTLRGRNTAEGRLDLEEFTGKTLSARLALLKETEGGAISWRGEMHNVDGRILKVAFTRKEGESNRAPSGTPADSSAASVYLAVLTRFDDRTDAPQTVLTTAALTWAADGRVAGTLVDPSTRKAFSIQGRNAQPGTMEAVLTEKGGMRCEAALTKTTGPKALRWAGAVQRSPNDALFHLELYRRTDGGKNPPVTVRECCVEVPHPSSTVTQWAPPEFAARELSRSQFFNVQRRSDSGSVLEYFPARIAAVEHASGELKVRLALDERLETYALRVVVPAVREITLRAAYPKRPDFLFAGDACDAAIDSAGSLSSLVLPDVTVTHWRKRADGMVEIKVLPAGALPGRPVRPSDLTPAKLRTLLPDKLSLDESPVDPSVRELGVKTVSFDRLLGFIIRGTDRGPGELEIEAALPSLKPPAEQPWVSIFEQGGASALAKSQWAPDGG